MSSETCVYCKKAISGENEEFVSLGERFYHSNHFRCHRCDKDLAAEENFFEIEENVFCEQDYYDIMAPKCFGCKKPCLGEYKIIQGKNFHQECFKCAKCSKAIKESEFFPVQDEPFCKACFDKNEAKECHGCKKHILDRQFKALGKFWHYACLRCLNCQQTFSEVGFITVDGNPFHEECVQIICYECDEVVEEEYLEVEGESIHEKCLEAFKKRDRSKPKPVREKPKPVIKPIEEKPAEKKKDAPPSFNDFLKKKGKDVPANTQSSPPGKPSAGPQEQAKGEQKVAEAPPKKHEEPHEESKVEQEKEKKPEEMPKEAEPQEKEPVAKAENLVIKKPAENPQPEKIEKVAPTRGAPNFMTFMKSKASAPQEKKEAEQPVSTVEPAKKEDQSAGAGAATEQPATQPSGGLKIEKKFIKHHNRFKN